jgi:hypothetical protein
MSSASSLAPVRALALSPPRPFRRGARRLARAPRAAASADPSPTAASKLEGAAAEAYMATLAEDLTHLFDDRGIDRSLYEPTVRFEDPLTKYDDIEGYLFNIAMLRRVFDPTYTMHAIALTGDWEVSTRWTMDMSLPLPWRPSLTFTGTSVMGIDPATMRVATHFDTWDAISTQGFFLETKSPEAVAEVLRQVFDLTVQPDLETPEYVVLRRYAEYEIRRYPDVVVAETKTGGESGVSEGKRLAAGGMTGGGGGGDGSFNPFGALAGYIFGGNAEEKKMEMTTPVFTSDDGKMQFVMGRALGDDPSALPAPNDGERVGLGIRTGGVFAAVRFNGVATDASAAEAERRLSERLARDGHARKPGAPASLAQYNDPLTNPIRRRNDVLVEIEGFDNARLDL